MRYFTVAIPSLVALILGGCATKSSSEAVDPAEAAHVHGSMHLVGLGPDDCPVCAIYEKHSASVIRLRSGDSVGTGVVISDHGIILTNAHVVGDAPTVVVETVQGTMVRGRVVRVDTMIDLALVLASNTDVMWAPIDAGPVAPIRVGSPIYVIGHPLGFGWTVTQGVLSSRRGAGEVGPIELLQTDAAISPGNSGGPIFDSQARPVGLVVSKIVTTGAENIGFAIPWSVVVEFVDREPIP